jgi:hypothetical protein
VIARGVLGARRMGDGKRREGGEVLVEVVLLVLEGETAGVEGGSVRIRRGEGV